MKTSNKTCILVDGSLRSAGLTFYTRSDKTIVRCAKKQRTQALYPGGRRVCQGGALGSCQRGVGKYLLIFQK